MSAPKNVNAPSTPLFSIVTVTFNSENTLRRTVMSLIDQTEKDFEYIIIDGKSNDNTINIIKSYEKVFFDKGIKFYHKSEPDKGIYDAMNKAIKLCKGRYIAFINSDDWYELNTLEIIKSYISNSPVDLYHGKLNLYDQKANYLQTISPKGESVVSRKMPFFHPTCFISKRVYDKLNGFNLNYKICADYEFIIRLLSLNVKTEYINKPLANFTKGGVSTTKIKEALEESHQIRIDRGFSPFKSKLFYFAERFICKLKYS